jgi:hypothetical protein
MKRLIVTSKLSNHEEYKQVQIKILMHILIMCIYAIERTNSVTKTKYDNWSNRKPKSTLKLLI